MNILNADKNHIAAIQAIYAHHVSTGLGSFETLPPSAEEMASRIAKVQQEGLIWLVAEMDGCVMGYCYLSFYRTRYAYRYTLEDSVYVAADYQGRGVGKTLLQHAIDWAQQQGYRQMIANVGNSENHGSLALHESLGFTLCGTLHSVGLKHGQWLDTVFLQRELGEGDRTLPDNAASMSR
ncbi:phosphinothricin acetyltransferase [Erwinia toletana]|uniref:Phosphinothricin acetyltransferase n=1 Tax=Winslowiella toletana TaxID=92490 RepID=A0ABS4P569_9GAMM|nr:GNAT family N-acetyltransferase [Winslowiella toletana]MBP2167113.1 phosphinothricin acetyltransferase [Winslowiella toletana]